MPGIVLSAEETKKKMNEVVHSLKMLADVIKVL